MLERSGWSVLLAADTEAAVETLAGQPCDVMFADWGAMNEQNGFETFCQRLESVRPGSSARVIVITGSLESSLPDRLALTVLSKPFGNSQLQQAIARLAATDT